MDWLILAHGFASSCTLPKGLLQAIIIQTTFSSDQLVQYFNLNNFFILFYFILFLFYFLN
jgi:hypothetical protein